MHPHNNNLLIIGAGQYGFVAKEIAQAMNCFGEIAFLGEIGSINDIEKFAGDFHYGFVAFNNPEIRRKFIELLRYNGFIPAILKHPQAYVGTNVQLQIGCCIEPLAIVQNGAVIATASFIASGAVIKHNAFIGEYCNIDSNAVVESNAIVPAETNIGCNSVFCKEQGVCLADNSFMEA